MTKAVSHVDRVVQAWKDDEPDALDQLEALRPDEQAQALVRLGYSTPAHVRILKGDR